MTVKHFSPPAQGGTGWQHGAVITAFPSTSSSDQGKHRRQTVTPVCFRNTAISAITKPLFNCSLLSNAWGNTQCSKSSSQNGTFHLSQVHEHKDSTYIFYQKWETVPCGLKKKRFSSVWSHKWDEVCQQSMRFFLHNEYAHVCMSTHKHIANQGQKSKLWFRFALPFAHVWVLAYANKLSHS